MKVLIHSVRTYEYLTVVEAETEQEALEKFSPENPKAFMRVSPEEVQTMSEVPNDYNLREDAESKGYY